VQVTCHRCGLEIACASVGVRDCCEACTAYLHCCRNCDFYEPGASNDCREPNAERVVEKELANFCDYFRPAIPRRDGPAPSAGPRAALDALFRRKP
jgi:hypothetical protein